MLLKTKNKATSLALTGIIGALYFILCMIFYPISYGGIQVRIAEALTILPIFFGEAIWGLTIGCLLANFFSPNVPVLDVVFGTLATFISAVITYFLSKKIKNPKIGFFIGAFPPVIINAVIVPFTFLAVTELKELYFISAIEVFLGQALSIYILGAILYFSLLKYLPKNKISF